MHLCTDDHFNLGLILNNTLPRFKQPNYEDSENIGSAIFCFSNIFYPIRYEKHHFNKIYFVVCSCFQLFSKLLSFFKDFIFITSAFSKFKIHLSVLKESADEQFKCMFKGRSLSSSFQYIAQLTNGLSNNVLPRLREVYV